MNLTFSLILVSLLSATHPGSVEASLRGKGGNSELAKNGLARDKRQRALKMNYGYAGEDNAIAMEGADESYAGGTDKKKGKGYDRYDAETAVANEGDNTAIDVESSGQDNFNFEDGWNEEEDRAFVGNDGKYVYISTSTSNDVGSPPDSAADDVEDEPADVTETTVDDESGDGVNDSTSEHAESIMEYAIDETDEITVTTGTDEDVTGGSEAEPDVSETGESASTIIQSFKTDEVAEGAETGTTSSLETIVDMQTSITKEEAPIDEAHAIVDDTTTGTTDAPTTEATDAPSMEATEAPTGDDSHVSVRDVDTTGNAEETMINNSEVVMSAPEPAGADDGDLIETDPNNIPEVTISQLSTRMLDIELRVDTLVNLQETVDRLESSLAKAHERIDAQTRMIDQVTSMLFGDSSAPDILADVEVPQHILEINTAP